MIESPGLTAGEQEYVRRVDVALHDLAPQDRHRLLDEVRQHLGERPSTEADVHLLIDDLGSPEEYASQLRTEHGLTGARSTGSPDDRWWRSWLGPFAGLMVIVGVAIGFRYVTVAPNLHNSCGGMVADGVESTQTVTTDEFRAPYRANGRIGIEACPGSTDGVIITGIHAPDPGGQSLAFVGTERSQSDADGPNFVGDASNFTAIDLSSEAQQFKSILVWFEMRGCNEGYEVVDRVDVDYRWRGRNRTMSLPLGYSAVIARDEACTPMERAEWFDSRDRFQERLYEQIDPSDLVDIDERRASPDAIGNNLCRYLQGIQPLVDPEYAAMNQFEPLDKRAVFQIEDRDAAEAIIVAAVEGMCSNFADRRDELVAMLPE